MRKLASEQPIGISRAITIGRQILLGLDAVHAAGVLHRDLKSDNVVISHVGALPRAVIVDFSLATPLAGRYGGRVPMSGSIGYMAPEQLEGGPLSLQTDIFAFGVVIFELLTGSLPFDRRSTDASPVEPLSPAGASGMRPDMPTMLATVVDRCLRRSPVDRYPNAGAVLAAIDRIK